METGHVRKRLFGRGEVGVESNSIVRALQPLLNIEVRHLPLILPYYIRVRTRRIRRTSDISVGMQLTMKEREFWMRG